MLQVRGVNGYRAVQATRYDLINLEHLSDEELERLPQEFSRVRERPAVRELPA